MYRSGGLHVCHNDVFFSDDFFYHPIKRPATNFSPYVRSKQTNLSSNWFHSHRDLIECIVWYNVLGDYENRMDVLHGKAQCVCFNVTHSKMKLTYVLMVVLKVPSLMLLTFAHLHGYVHIWNERCHAGSKFYIFELRFTFAAKQPVRKAIQEKRVNKLFLFSSFSSTFIVNAKETDIIGFSFSLQPSEIKKLRDHDVAQILTRFKLIPLLIYSSRHDILNFCLAINCYWKAPCWQNEDS